VRHSRPRPALGVRSPHRGGADDERPVDGDPRRHAIDTGRRHRTDRTAVRPVVVPDEREFERRRVGTRWPAIGWSLRARPPEIVTVRPSSSRHLMSGERTAGSQKRAAMKPIYPNVAVRTRPTTSLLAGHVRSPLAFPRSPCGRPRCPRVTFVPRSLFRGAHSVRASLLTAPLSRRSLYRGVRFAHTSLLTDAPFEAPTSPAWPVRPRTASRRPGPSRWTTARRRTTEPASGRGR